MFIDLLVFDGAFFEQALVELLYSGFALLLLKEDPFVEIFLELFQVLFLDHLDRLDFHLQDFQSLKIISVYVF